MYIHACKLYGHIQAILSLLFSLLTLRKHTYMYCYLFPTVDARMFTLPNGSPIYVFVREGLVYIPNPELAKILPAVSRTAMENIRNSYGITVYQVSPGLGISVAIIISAHMSLCVCMSCLHVQCTYVNMYMYP